MMPTNINSRAQHDSAIQKLVEDTELPVATVAEIYESELLAIQSEVRITQFVSLIVTRRVVRSLRERGLVQ